MSNVMWQQSADFGSHLCHVTQTDDRSGMLIIRIEDGSIIHEQPVVLTGNIEADVEKWKGICIDIIDHPDKWSALINGDDR